MKQYNITINGNDYNVVINSLEENRANVTVNGAEYTAEVEGLHITPQASVAVQQQTVVIPANYPPVTARAAAPSVAPAPAPTPAPAPSSAPASSGGASIKSPLPGVILEVLVREGDVIKMGQKVMTLEAMKMENNIESDVEGTIAKVNKSAGDSVLEGDVLILFT